MLKICGALLLVLTLFLGGWFYSNSSSHFIFNPYIDTIFAPGFNTQSFNEIEQGMTKDQVLTKLGEPLSRDYWGNNPKCWQYSTDGKLWPKADFSYYLFQICFDDTHLVESKPVQEFFN